MSDRQRQEDAELAFRKANIVTEQGWKGERQVVGAKYAHWAAKVRARWELEHIEFRWADGSWRPERPPSRDDMKLTFRRKAQ